MGENEQPTKQGIPSKQSMTTPKESQGGNPLPEFKVSVNKAGDPVVNVEASSGELAQLVGLKDDTAGSFLITQIADALKPFRDSAPSWTTAILNKATALLAELKPQDAYEGILTSQMIAAHNQAMECMRRANLSEQTSYGRELNLRFGDRFLRTYTAQMEALTKYRRGGQQKVTVEHVHVHEGGQAIVGTVSHQGGEGDGKKK